MANSSSSAGAGFQQRLHLLHGGLGDDNGVSNQRDFARIFD